MSNETGHWYTRDGTPRHTQSTKKGAKNPTRPTTIKDAKEQKLLPSVSAYTKMLAAPGLERYKMMEVAKCCFNSPPHAGEEMDTYVQAMMEKSREDGKGAADLGTLIHAAIEKKALNELYDDVDVEVGMNVVKLSALVDPAFETIDKLGLVVKQAEKVLVNNEEGYAGTSDVVHESANYFGILDWKSKRTKKGEDVWPSDTHPMQIAAYLQAAFPDTSWESARCYNVYISTTEPGRVDIVKYTPNQLIDAYIDFLALTRLWRSINKYDPRNSDG